MHQDCQLFALLLLALSGVCVWGGRGYSSTPIHSCPELYALLHTICNICVYTCIYVYKYMNIYIEREIHRCVYIYIRICL